MEHLQFGNLRISDTNDGIQFAPTEAGAVSTRIDSSDVPVLMSFLQRHLEQSANRRGSWRLHVAGIKGTIADELTVTLVNSERVIFPARTINLSLTGILVCAETLPAAQDDPVNVIIALGNYEVTLRGVIVRTEGATQELALHFPECVGPGNELRPPTALREIFATLEELWLDKELGLEWR